jgi:hypothetical protein
MAGCRPKITALKKSQESDRSTAVSLSGCKVPGQGSSDLDRHGDRRRTSSEDPLTGGRRGGPMQRTWSGPPPVAHGRRPGVSHLRGRPRRPGCQIFFASIAATLVTRGSCVARASRCKVNDGVDLYVAVNVKGVVKVNVEDQVKNFRNRFRLGRWAPAHARQGTCPRRRLRPKRARSSSVSTNAPRTGARARLLLASLSAFAPRVHRRADADLPHRQDPESRKGAAAILRCAQNEHDRSTVGVSIPYACA